MRFSVNSCNFHIDILIATIDTGGELEASFHVRTQVCPCFQVKELPFWHPQHFPAVLNRHSEGTEEATMPKYFWAIIARL